MNEEKLFAPTKSQQVEFSALAIKRIKTQCPRVIPADLQLSSAGYRMVSFSSAKHRYFMLTFQFSKDGMNCVCRRDVFSRHSSVSNDVLTETIQPLYFNYMYQAFGEPYRQAALTYWQKHLWEEYNAHMEQKQKQIAQLEQAEKALSTKQIQTLSALYALGNANGADKTEEQFFGGKLKSCKVLVKGSRKIDLDEVNSRAR